MPCVTQSLELGSVGVDVLSSTDLEAPVIQHQEYAQGLADGCGHAPVQEDSRAGPQTRNQKCPQLSFSGAE